MVDTNRDKGLAVVIGGTGFLGRSVVSTLVNDGWRVRVAARRPQAFEGAESVECVRADVRSDDDTAAALAGADCVINAISLYVEGDVLDFRSIHVEGAERLARTARTAGVGRLIHVSGIGVDPHSTSPYVRARADGEAIAQATFPQTLVMRPSVIFGSGDAFLAALDSVTRLPVVPLFGRGEMRLQPVHVEDVAKAVVAALAASPVADPIFELGGADTVRYRELLEAIMQVQHRHRPLVPVPMGVWQAIAWFSSMLPRPPLTRDQVSLMAADNVAAPDMPGFEALGIHPSGVLDQLANCLPSGSHH